MFPIIDLGPFAIQAPGLILLLSLLVGIWLTGKLSDSLGANGEVIENSLLIGLVAGILSARIGFFLQNPTIFLENPLSLLSLTPTMLNTSFGILAGVLGAFITAQKNHLPLWPTLDTLTPLILILFIGRHFANFASGNAYGLSTSLPWGVQLWGALRHPVQIYALILALILFIWVWFKTKGLTRTGYWQSGVLVLVTLTALAAITLFTRAFVAEKILLQRLDLIQAAAFFVILAALGLFYRRSIQPQKQVRVILSIGSNMEPHKNLHLGIEHLTKEFKLKRSSSVYHTSDVRQPDKADRFLNQVVEIETAQSFLELRKNLKMIERQLGRERGNKAVVPLDLDILTYNDDVFVTDQHQIPEPDLERYRYLAKPLAEMSPEFRHPANGKSIQQILKQIKDKAQVQKLNEVENGTQR
jgi:phosphatidylglycerol---prolipoprotein diacylglyceryl transferase